MTAREIIAALPHELDEPQREAVTRTYAHWLAERFRVAVDVAWHPPSASGDRRNHHLHMQFTTREVADGFAFGAKTRILDAAATGGPEIAVMRAEWAAAVNAALEAAGREERIDHRSLADRGIDREPGQHLGPMRVNMIRAKLKRVAAFDAEIAELQAEIAALEAEERQERDQARRPSAPAVVIVDQRMLGPLGPYMVTAAAPALAGVSAPVKPAVQEAIAPPPPRDDPIAQPAPEPEPVLAGVPSTATTPTASPQEVRPGLSTAALEGVVGDAALAEVARLNRVHADAWAEKRRAKDEAEAGTTKARRRGSAHPAALQTARVKPPPEPGKPKRKRATPYADVELPPLKAPVPKLDEDDDRPKKPKAKPPAPIGRTKGMSMAIGRATTMSRSRGRNGRGR